jgi:hypothetical protein
MTSPDERFALNQFLPVRFWDRLSDIATLRTPRQPRDCVRNAEIRDKPIPKHQLNPATGPPLDQDKLNKASAGFLLAAATKSISLDKISH